MRAVPPTSDPDHTHVFIQGHRYDLESVHPQYTVCGCGDGRHGTGTTRWAWDEDREVAERIAAATVMGHVVVRFVVATTPQAVPNLRSVS